MKKIIFLGYASAINLENFGGTESLLRRIILNLSDNQYKIFLVGSRKPKTEKNISYFNNLRHALDEISSLSKKYININVIKMYLPFKDRLKLILFRMLNNKINFHLILTSWSPYIHKKFSLIFDAFFLNYNGSIIVVSKRQHKWISFFFKNSILIYPPVSDFFFSKKIKINRRFIFIGRLDKSKGIDKTIKIFKWLKKQYNCDVKIIGIKFSNNKYSEKIHNYLNNQKLIDYEFINRQKYSLKIEKMVAAEMKKSTFFIQPYNNVYGTIDSPLLILESMASNCIVFSSNDSNVKDIYGSSKSLVEIKENGIENLKNAIKYYLNNENEISKEIKRVNERVKYLKFSIESTLDSINKYL